MTDAEIATGLRDLLARHASQLSEHFGSIQILASKLNPDSGTAYFAIGEGDWYARQGLAQRFIKSNEAEEMAWQLSQVIQDEE